MQAGQHPALTVKVDAAQVQVTALSNDPTVLVVDGASNVDPKCACALHRTPKVGQARRLDTRIAALTVDQAIRVVEDLTLIHK